MLILALTLSGCTEIKEEIPSPVPEEQIIQTESPTPTDKEEKPEGETKQVQTETPTDTAQSPQEINDDMKRIVEFLTINKNVQMATVGLDGTPSIRTIWFQFNEDGKIYFQTDVNSSLYQNLVSMPYIEFVSVNEDNTQTLRVRAEVAFDDKPELVERVLKMYPSIKKYYDSIGNPELTMFYLKRGSASIFEFSDEKQETILMYEW
jgi:uncharacterized pyridoxamine 5'-phosphate oxidase family protein